MRMKSWGDARKRKAKDKMGRSYAKACEGKTEDIAGGV